MSAWPWYATAVLALGVGAATVGANWPSPLPAEDRLVRLSGSIETLSVVDELSGTSVGVLTPDEAVLITLAGVDGVLRYPLGWPRYLEVRRSLGVALDAWVDPGELAAGGPATVWRLEERNPFKRRPASPDPEIAVSYAEIAARTRQVRSSWLRVGAALLATGTLLLVAARMRGRSMADNEK